MESVVAFGEGFARLRERHFVAVELFWNFPISLGAGFASSGFYPHQAHVVHVGDDGGDVAAFAVGRLGAPGLGRQIFDEVVIDAVARVKGREHGVGQDEGFGSLW